MSALISAEYLDLQRQLHATPKGYGGKGAKWADVVRDIAVGCEAAAVLDYGCGQGSLARALRPDLRVAEYDPAIVGKDAPPAPADLVVSTDVLEHIEPDHIDGVLDHIGQLTLKRAFLVISLVPAQKVLGDGRNAHILLKPVEWWMREVGRRLAFERFIPCREDKELAGVWCAT